MMKTLPEVLCSCSSSCKKTPVFGTISGIPGSIQVIEMIKYLTGTGYLLKNSLLIWDGLRSEADIIELSRSLSCDLYGPDTLLKDSNIVAIFSPVGGG